jgi:hypothetical protein
MRNLSPKANSCSTPLAARPVTGLCVAAAMVLLCAAPPQTRAQIQSAGTLYINLDATTLAVGTTKQVANAGTLGGLFVATNNVLVTNMTPASPVALYLGSSTANNHLLLKTDASGSLIAPPSDVMGVNPSCSIEVWAFNPTVQDEECLIAWGARASAQNMTFNYGYNGAYGAVEHGASAMTDTGWDPFGGAPLSRIWHHLVYTYDGTTQKLYVDGALVSSKAVSYTLSTGAGFALGAQWNSAGTAVSTSPAWASLALAKVRVHGDALNAAQVLNNFNVEKATFQPTPPASTFLAHGPVHRYSFNEPATPNANGLTIQDSVGGANGVVRGSAYFAPAQFTGRRLVLPGGFHATNTASITGYGAAYADLPNGLISGNSTNNGGSGELSVEVWYRNYAGAAASAARIFEAGSTGPAATQVGAEITAPGNFPSGASGLDYFAYAQVGGGVNQRRLQWQNKDKTGSGLSSSTNSAGVSYDTFSMGTYQTDQHIVVTWNESTSVVQAFENGVLANTIVVSNAMSTLNDLNVWLGRSVNSLNDTGPGYEYEEVRFYTNVLTPGEIVADWQTGPNTLNLAEQNAAVLQGPKSATVLEGAAVSFWVAASGSPAVSYQWLRNSTPIAGATTDSYTLTAASLTNNGASFSCLVSNYANGAAHTQTSAGATLTVSPNQGLQTAILHETRPTLPTSGASFRNNFAGVVGGFFTSGSNATLVTHLGFYDQDGDGLATDHRVGLYDAIGTYPPLAYVTVPTGASGYLLNGYRYVALDTPFVLAPNTRYVVAAEVFNPDPDSWPDTAAYGMWDPALVGSNPSFTRGGRYGGAWGTGVGTGTAPGLAGNNSAYAAGNLATLALGAPVTGLPQTNFTYYSGQTVAATVLVCGELPLSVQWYRASDNSLLPGQTNCTLRIPNVQGSAAGDYYLIAANSQGNAQSANITLTVLADTPVSVTEQPASTTVPEGFPASFTLTLAGTPPYYYQWKRNGTLIDGATASSYTLAYAALTNSGDKFLCVVSNYANGGPHTATSVEAVLTVQPNQAPASQTLYSGPQGAMRDNYTGLAGGLFQVGATPVLVNYLGYYCANGTLNSLHHVGLFPGLSGPPIAEVVVPGGDTNSFIWQNNFAWIRLDPPLLLAANSNYIIAAETYQSGDAFPDVAVPAFWNPFFVGTADASTRGARFHTGYWTDSPNYPASASTGNGIYAAANIALLAAGPAVAAVPTTNVQLYAGQDLAIGGLVGGQPLLTVQWYKAPGTLLSGQTKPTLSLPAVQLSDSGDYYLVANNPLGQATSQQVHVQVLPPAPPAFAVLPQSQAVYAHQALAFSAQVTGLPPLSYQWSFNGAALPGETTNVLYLSNVSAAQVGTYTLSVTNSLGWTNASAQLSLLTPPSGSYLASALALNPIVYYRFEDAGTSPTTFNFGSYGVFATGTFEGDGIAVTGPSAPQFPNFDDANVALSLPGTNADVIIPPLNLTGGPNVTMAAWINSAIVPQTNYAGIIFHRPTQVAAASGLGVKTNSATGADMLCYHWANTQYTFNSGLDIPVNQWVFVALVVQPSQATLYLFNNGVMSTATNIATHATVAFGEPTRVGYDSTMGRYFNGAIDEPMIFSRALSQNQLKALYTAASTTFLSITQSQGKVVLTWPVGTLQQADQVNGTYVDMTGITSPYTNTPAGTRFYRVKVQ